MKANKRDKNKCGIYLIRNLINGKVYVGKSNNIYKRIISHISNLNRANKKSENEHLINSWIKYGKDKFCYCILEECSFESLSERELYWIEYYNSISREIGYNFRVDSSSGMIPLESTRKKYSEAQIKRFSNPNERLKQKISQEKFWNNNKLAREEMSKKVSEAKKKFIFYKLDENENILERFNSIEEIISKNPHYKWQNIYSVCNGYKKRIYGYKWKKEQMI